jgi:DNA-binding NtrC family response regulator
MSKDLNGGIEVARAAHAHRVLIVDDEMLIRWALAQALGDAGCVVTEAASARDARSALRAGDFDVVILDYRLPDTTHLDLLREVRALSPASHVIMMTAFGTPEMFEEAMDLGVIRVLDKPIDLDKVVPAILGL